MCPPSVTNRLLATDGGFMKMISKRRVLVGQFGGGARPYSQSQENTVGIPVLNNPIGIQPDPSWRIIIGVSFAFQCV